MSGLLDDLDARDARIAELEAVVDRCESVMTRLLDESEEESEPTDDPWLMGLRLGAPVALTRAAHYLNAALSPTEDQEG